MSDSNDGCEPKIGDKREREVSISSEISETTYKEKKNQKNNRVLSTQSQEKKKAVNPLSFETKLEKDEEKKKGTSDEIISVAITASQKNPIKKKQLYSTPAAVAVSTSVIPTNDPSTSFSSMGLIQPLLEAVEALGYKSPSPIQQQAIPNALIGKDIFACAQTGTGKTAAFALPIINILYKRYVESGNEPASTAMKALILTPTRELAAQINDHTCALTKNLTKNDLIAHLFGTTVIVGGVNSYPQIKALQKRPAIVIATPGRLLDIRKLRKTVCDFSAIEFLVIDEADRMLDMGFYPDVSKIVADLPAYKQSLFFSATFTKPIRQLANTILRAGEVAEIHVTPPVTTLNRIKQSYYMVSRDKKDEALKFVIEKNNWFQVLVFTRTKEKADAVTQKLNKWGISALSIHGGKSQNSRVESLKNFKSGKLRVLVATDIAARGIDISDLPHVINYELPSIGKDYVHRIGRTGRAGKEGFAVSLVDVDEESIMVSIQRFAFKQTEMCDIPLGDDLPTDLQPREDEVPLPVPFGTNSVYGTYTNRDGANTFRNVKQDFRGNYDSKKTNRF